MPADAGMRGVGSPARREAAASGQYCATCGAQLQSPPPKFCPLCGTPVRAPKPARRGHLRLALAVVGALVLAVAGVVLLRSKGGSPQGGGGEEKEVQQLTEDDGSGQDVDSSEEADYYLSQSTVLDTVMVRESKEIRTEHEAAKEFGNRGFGDEVLSTCDMEGNYYDERIVDADSQEQHPTYRAYFETSKGDWWVIYQHNGEWMATPILINDSSRDDVYRVIVSEHEYVTSYDSETDSFYLMIPDATASVLQVDRLDSQALESIV